MPTPILHLADAATWRGGEQQVLYLHEGLLARNWDSTVVCREGGALHGRLRQRDLPHWPLPLRGALDLPSAWELGRRARSRGAIVHTHTSHAHGLALWASRLTGRFPLVVSRRVDFPVARISGGKYRSRRVDRYLSISSGVTRELRAGGVDEARIRSAPSGVDFGRFASVTPRREWRESFSEKPLFGNVAALAPHKDQRTLLAAFALYREAGGRGHLVILGEGDLRAELETQRTQLGLQDRVHLPGFVDDVLGHMAALDVFVMSSRLEGLGTAILDAMALGRPVVATRTGGIPDAVIHERTGLLVPPEDPPALAAALSRLADDARLREALVEAASRHVREFDVERTVERTIEVYEELC